MLAQPDRSLPPANRRARRRRDVLQPLGFALTGLFGLLLIFTLFGRAPDQAAAPGAIEQVPARPAQPTAAAAPVPTLVATATPTAIPTQIATPTATVVPTATATAAPRPTAEPVDPTQIPAGHAAVNATIGLNVRSLPSYAGEILQVLPDRQIVRLSGQLRLDGDGTWRELDEPGGGWVLETYLVLAA